MSIYYLVSSLPSFNFGDKPFYTSEGFVRQCSDWISPENIKELERVSLIPVESYSGNIQFIKSWYELLGALNCYSVKYRALKLNRDSSSILEERNKIYSDIEKGVQEAFSSENPMEKEKRLDRLKWSILDSLEVGHMFDFDKLCIYKLRTLLCEKWLTRKEPEGKKNLEAALSVLYKPTDESN
ncbi:MAG: DUF2764 family protein [Lentisphaerota bacterium]